MDDRLLLEEYVQRGSESAFRTIVERHLNLVRSAALRQVNESALADEVSQAVFILLARKAGSLPRGVILSGWLFRTTRFVAARTLRGEERRRRREQEAFEMQTLNAEGETWKRVAPVLDEALEQLPDADRNAVLLRFCEKRHHQEVGAALGLSEEAARKRINRALDKLRSFFAQRGCVLTATGLASLLTANAIQAAPAGLATTIAESALACGTTSAATLPVIVQEVLSAWRWAKVKLSAAMAGGLAVLVGIGIAIAPSKPTETPAPSPAGSQPPGVEAAAQQNSSQSFAAGTALERSQSNGQVLRLQVVAKDTGQAVPNATLAVNTVADGKWEYRFDLATDHSGYADVPYPSAANRLDVGALAWGHAARFATWMPARGDAIPADYILRLDRITNAMSGWLRDSNDRPVANAEILVAFGSTGDSAHRETPRERPGVMGEPVIARSDEKGWWVCAIIPPQNHGGFHLKARHPHFRTTAIVYSSGRTEPEGEEAETLRQLWAGTLVTRMSVGPSLTGRVLGPGGDPVSGAEVVHQPHSDRPLSMRTDAGGRFSFSNLERTTFDFTVIAAGFAPAYREVDLSAGSTSMDVQLEPGAVLRLRLVDEQGAPVSDASVDLEQWGENRHKLKWTAQSDSNGRIVWESAPPNAKLELCAIKPGWCYTRDIWVKADGTEHVISMRRTLVLMGGVTDAETGQPIADVKAFPGYGTGEYAWQRSDTRRGANGAFTVEFSETRTPWRLRIEAEGYLPFVSEPISPDAPGWLDVTLRRQDLSKAIRGVVLEPDGRPAAGAQVALLTLEHNVRLEGSRLRSDSAIPLIKTTDNSGGFSFAPDPQAHSVVASGDAGYATFRVRDQSQPVRIQLQSWARIEGVISPKARTRPVESVVLNDPSWPNYQGRVSLGFRAAKPDDEGRFSFDFAPPQTLVLWLNSGVGIPFHHRTPVTLKPGETALVAVDGTGWRVKGRLVPPPEIAVDWERQLTFANIASMTSQVRPPAELDRQAAALWLVDFWTSESGRILAANQYSVKFEVLRDGSFMTDDTLPEGECLVRAITARGNFEARVNISPPAGESGSVCDLGDVRLGPFSR